MSSITPLRFTGVSSFSEDFQAIMTRATQIATLPVQQLQNQQANLLGRKQSLTDLNTRLQSLTSAVEKLGELGRERALSVTSSNTSRVTVINNGVTSATSYTISEITSVARAASETFQTGLATGDTTAVDSDDSLELVLGSETFALDLSGGNNNLNGLASEINASGAGVTATVLNTGSLYYLSVTANAPGAKALQLRTTAGDSGTNLLTSTNQGANAVFKFNGLPVERSDNVVSDVATGLTFTIQDETSEGETVTLTASSSRGSLATGLSELVTAYNAARQQVNRQIGETAGALSGDQIIGQISRALRELTGYQGTGSVKSLAALGIELDKSGVMSFNTAKFYALNSTSLSAAFDFFGSETTGFGGLSAKLDQISNPFTGFIRTQQNSYDSADQRIAKQIGEMTSRIERMQSGLSLKLQQADALLAGLQSQQSQLEASIKSVNFALYGKQT